MKLFAPFAKVDADERIVSGYASTEALDSQGEVIKREALERALPEYLKFANIREMHQPSAVGVALKAQMDDKGLLLEAHVVDDAAWKKVKANVYKGFSIGGRVTNRDSVNKSIITGIHLSEISIVDRPANPEALFDVWKAEGVVAGEDEPQAEDAEAALKENPEDVAKSMYGVGRLADILSQIQYAAQDAEWEAEFERDGSTIPDDLKAWLKTGGQLLVQMAAEETAEMTGEETAAVEVIALADAAADLAKGGKRNSKADQKKLNDAHEAIVAAGADCGGSMKSDDAEDLTKAAEELASTKGDLAKAHDELAKAASDLAEALVKVGEGKEALASMTKSRDEATASLIALGKSHESATQERDDLSKRNETLIMEKGAADAENTSLKAEVEKLKAEPEPMKAKLLVVGKGEEVVDTTKAFSAMGSVEETPSHGAWFTARPI